MTRLACGLLLLTLAACRKTPTAPETLRCITVTQNVPIRNMAGDSVSYFTVTTRQCPRAR